MARHTYRECKYCGDWHDIAAWPPNHRDAPMPRSDLPAPYFISDTMDALMHPISNRPSESKAEFRAMTKAGDGIEVGNEEQKDTRHYDTITPDDVAQAIQKVEQGYKPRPEQATKVETQDAIL